MSIFHKEIQFFHTSLNGQDIVDEFVFSTKDFKQNPQGACKVLTVDY